MRSRTLFPAAVLFALPLFASSYPGFGTYTYDGAGNVIAVGGHTFVYDRSSRIEKATLGTGRSAEYTYDRYGNILTITTDGDWSSRGKPGVNRLTNRIDQTVDENGFGNNMIGTYDGAGNLRTYNGSTTFVYDALDTITESNVDGVRRLYLYSATNERIAIVAMAGSTPLRWDWTIRDTNGKVLRRFSRDQANTWSWDQDYIYRSGQLLAAEKPADTLHFHLDHLGTPRVISNRNGGLVSQHTYYPFGRELTSPFQDTEAMKFTGHERDSANLDYMHARSYLPYTGRFVSVDPKRSGVAQAPQSWNRYAYARNNPLKYIDPDGRDVHIAVTNIVVGTTTVNSLPDRKGDTETVPAYKIVAMNEAGSVALFAGSRDTNYEGTVAETRGKYGSNHEAPPGSYFGRIRTDGKRGARIELSDTKGGDSIAAPDGTTRKNVQIHIGPGCSKGCVLLTGGTATRDAFIKTVEDMQKAEREAGRGDQIHVMVTDRNTDPDVTDEDTSKDQDE